MYKVNLDVFKPIYVSKRFAALLLPPIRSHYVTPSSIIELHDHTLFNQEIVVVYRFIKVSLNLNLKHIETH
jgi:hypothetical protein